MSSAVNSMHNNLPQPPYQPPLPQSPHSQHHSPPIIFLVAPVRIPQDQRREPEARSHPGGDGDAGGIKGRKDVDERQEDGITFPMFSRTEVVLQIGSVGGANEAQLVVDGWGEHGVELMNERYSRSDGDGDGREEEE